MTCLPQQTLTPSGLISLDATDGEVQLLSRSSVELRSLSSSPLAKPHRLSKDNSQGANAWVDRDTDLTVTVTTHRIVFQSRDSSRSSSSNTSRDAYFLHHCAITTHEECGGEWLSNRSFKIMLKTVSHGSFHLIFREGKSDRDAFSDSLGKAMTRKQWEETYRMQQTQQRRDNTNMMSGTGTGNDGMVTRKVGIDAILQRNKNKHDRAKELTNDAFGDAKKRKGKEERAREVEKLFREAKELTAIIHKYTATLEKNKKESGGGDDDDTTELSSMMENMGMITALTKDTSSSYHETLARQIADFLGMNKKFMTAKGGSGIMSLTDLYCLFNRARGANMISPDDLIESLNLMQKLGLPVKLREFEESGVRCVIESTFDDAVMAKKILDYIEEKEGVSSSTVGAMKSLKRLVVGPSASEDDEHGLNKMNKYVGLTALEAAKCLNIPPILANEQLLSAERNGHLCRDVTLEGTRFYRNHFMVF